MAQANFKLNFKKPPTLEPEQGSVSTLVCLGALFSGLDGAINRDSRQKLPVTVGPLNASAVSVTVPGMNSSLQLGRAQGRLGVCPGRASGPSDSERPSRAFESPLAWCVARSVLRVMDMHESITPQLLPMLKDYKLHDKARAICQSIERMTAEQYHSPPSKRFQAHPAS
jgi:hypothetical protein